MIVNCLRKVIIDEHSITLFHGYNGMTCIMYFDIGDKVLIKAREMSNNMHQIPVEIRVDKDLN